MIKLLKNNSGQSLVEFIIVLPLVIMLIFAVLSFGFLIYDRMIVVLAASQAADKAAEVMMYDDMTLEEQEYEIRTVAKSFANYALLCKDTDIDIGFDTEKITVEVELTYTFVLPLLGEILGDAKSLPVNYKATYKLR